MNDDNRPPRPAPVNNLELKAALLLALFVALVAAPAHQFLAPALPPSADEPL